MPSKILVFGALAAATLSLGACGKEAVLERPPAPLFGKPRADAANPNKPSEPGSVLENKDPATSRGTTRQSPLPGAAPDPFGGPSGSGFPGSGPGRD